MEVTTELMEVKMTEPFMVAVDGLHAQAMAKGQKVTLPLVIAQGLIRDKLAIPITEVKKEEIKKEDEVKKPEQGK